MSEDIFERNKDLGEILRQVSGQLRSSLGNIYTAMENLAPPELREEDSKVDRNAAVLSQSYYRILRLTENLEEAAYLGRPGASVLQRGDIAHLCWKTAEDARHLANILGLKLEYNGLESRHIILMDSRRIKRLIMNLLSNAFKFTPSGGTVTMELQIEREWVKLNVSDTGCGIPAELRDTIFNRYLLTDRLDPPPHGLGLGLAICRQVAWEHGGSLLLTYTEVGKGTTMTVSLPNTRERFVDMESEPQMPIRPNTFNETLKELSDALPREAFAKPYMD